jgi:uncharacterized protein involved in exopolysaccharide biosynthesis
VLEVSAVIRPRWKEVAISGMIGAVLLGGLAFLMPPTYTADAKLLIMPQSGGMGAGTDGIVAALASAGANPLKNPNDMYASMLASRSVQLNVIESQGLRAHYATDILDDVTSRLGQSTRIMAGKDNLVRIEVIDHSPQKAADIANAYTVALQATTATLALTEAQARKQFLETRVEAVRLALSTAETALSEASKRSGIIDVAATVQASATLGAELEAHAAVKQAHLMALTQTAAPGNPELQAVKAELASLMAAVNKNKRANAAGMADEGLAYVRALREVKYQEALLAALAKQYEIARVDAAHSAGIVQVLDEARPPDYKTGPKRTLYALGGLLGGLLLGVLRIGRAASKQPG